MGDDNRIRIMLNFSGHCDLSERPRDQHRCKNATEEAGDQWPYLNHVLKITSPTQVGIDPDQALYPNGDELNEFATGERRFEIVNRVASTLGEPDRRAVAEYLSGLR